jgi:hypothetical protein
MPWLAFGLIASGLIAIAAYQAKGSSSGVKAVDLFGKRVTFADGTSFVVTGQSATAVYNGQSGRLRTDIVTISG